jgi:hypothetical protein
MRNIPNRWYAWAKITPHCRTFLNVEYTLDSFYIHIPLFQWGQNMTMDIVFERCLRQNRDVKYLNIVFTGE